MKNRLEPLEGLSNLSLRPLCFLAFRICTMSLSSPLRDHVCAFDVCILYYVDGIGETDWISLSLADLYSEFSVLCSAVSEICSDQSCPVMKSRGDLVYYWADLSSSEHSRPELVSSRRYMELLMSWADNFLNRISEGTADFPAGAFNIDAKIFCRRFFRVYAHLFCEHTCALIPAEKHLRYSLFHFIIFMHEFNLLVSLRDAEPLLHIINSFGIPNLRFPSD